MNHEELVGYIRESTESVFRTMLALELGPGPSGIHRGAVSASHGVAALVGFAGSWVGTGSVDCSPALACRFAGAMLSSVPQSVDDDVLDAMGEIANMIIGNIKNSVEAVVGPMELSLPTVVHGCHFITRSQRQSEWSVVPFACLGAEFTVQVMLIPGGCHVSPRQLASVSQVED